MATAPFAAPLGMPRFKSWLPAGTPNAAGKVNIYLAGTSTPDISYPTYNDALAGTNANANPVILDVNGEASIFVQSGRMYKLIVTDASNVTLPGGTIDFINPAAGFPAAGGAPFVSEWVPEQNGLLFLTGTSFRVTAVDVSGIYHPGRRVRTLNTNGVAFGTVTNSTFAAGSTVVSVVNDTINLDSGLSQAAYGLESYVNPSYLDPRTMLIATKTGDQAGPYTAATKVIAFSPDRDALLEWNSALSRWVPHFPGTYRVTFNLYIKDPAVSQGFFMYMARNGVATTPRFAGQTGTLANTGVNFCFTRDMVMLVGDYIEMWIFCTANTTVMATETSMSIDRIA